MRSQQLWKQHLQRNHREGFCPEGDVWDCVRKGRSMATKDGDERLTDSESLSLAWHRRQERRKAKSNAVAGGCFM